MILSNYSFSKKCDFDMCQNTADFVLTIGAKGNLLMCATCLEKLKKTLRIKKGDVNGATN